MKDFLENYGFAILGAIVVILLLVIATPVGKLINTRISSIVDSFAYRVNTKIEAVSLENQQTFSFEMLDYPEEPVNGTENVLFRSSAPLSIFKEVRVDNEVVDPVNYELTEGSTIVEFHADYILTLSEGIHGVEIISEQGKATSTLERELRNGVIDSLYYVDDELFTGEVEGNTYKNGVKINIISFTVSGTIYQAEEGMTWAEFCDSEYSSGLFHYDDIVYREYLNNYVFKNDMVMPANTIEANTEYYVNMCFSAGTKVLLANGITKNIEDMQVGDKIISYNPITNEYYDAFVEKLNVHLNTENLYNIKLSNGTILTLTRNHPVYTENGNFKNINGDIYEKLSVGDKVVTIDGLREITEISVEPYDEKYEYVYNLNVIDENENILNDDDTYDTFIANGIVVHNIVC